MLICPNVDKSCYVNSGDLIDGDEQGYDQAMSFPAEHLQMAPTPGRGFYQRNHPVWFLGGNTTDKN